MDSTKNLILVTYVSGSFGSALVNLLCGSPDCHGQFLASNGDNWHRQQWLFDSEKYASGFIDQTTEIQLPAAINQTEKYIVGQFHLMNADVLRKHFPQAKIIILSVDETQFTFALQRWWKVIGLKQLKLYKDRIEQISGAYDVIRFNREYYNRIPMETESSHNVLTINFDQTVDCLDLIQKFLGITLTSADVQDYTDYMKNNLATFYNVEDNFMFAQQAIDRLGFDAPIIDLANNFASTQELLDYLNEQK